MTSDKKFEASFGKFVVDFITYRMSHGKDATPNKLSQDVVYNFTEHDLFCWFERINTYHEDLLAGKESRMTDHHVKLLRELGFPFDRQGQNDCWNVMYDCLVDFHEEHGHIVVPRKGGQPFIT